MLSVFWLLSGILVLSGIYMDRLELPMSQTMFHCPKDVLAIEVRQYFSVFPFDVEKLIANTSSVCITVE